MKQSITDQTHMEKGKLKIILALHWFTLGKTAQETFHAGHKNAEKWIHVDFHWNKISWVCKFHSYLISTRPAGCKSADLIFQHKPHWSWQGRTWSLSLHNNGDNLTIWSSRNSGSQPLECMKNGLHSAMFIVSFPSLLFITSTWDSTKAFTRREGYMGQMDLFTVLWQTTWQWLMLFGLHLIHT